MMVASLLIPGRGNTMNRIAAVVAGLSLAFVGTSATFAATHTVCPNGCNYTSIHDAIDASVSGDVIEIAAGIYKEHSLDTDGKAITIQGAFHNDGSLATTIDADHGPIVFNIRNGEDNGTVIKNLIITGGLGTQGGGFFIQNSAPIITGCTITGNHCLRGGAIYCYDHGNPNIIDCTIENNSAGNGGGIYCNINSSPNIQTCSISSNTASSRGGGIYCYESNPNITGCTISGNTCNDGGGGIYCYRSSPTHSGCIFSSNTPDNVEGDPTWDPTLTAEPSIITLENCTLCGTGEHVTGLIVHLGENHISDCVDDGDVDGDGDVDTDDLAQLRGSLGLCASDNDLDGDTDIEDLLNLIEGWGTTCNP